MMQGWWATFGWPSLMVGCGLGLAWAFVNTARRKQKFKRAGLEPLGQRWWFLASFCSMAGYLTLVAALSLMALHDVLTTEATWFLLGAAGLAFCTALSFARFDAALQGVPLAPAAQLPVAKSLRRSA